MFSSICVVFFLLILSVDSGGVPSALLPWQRVAFDAQGIMEAAKEEEDAALYTIEVAAIAGSKDRNSISIRPYDDVRLSVTATKQPEWSPDIVMCMHHTESRATLLHEIAAYGSTDEFNGNQSAVIKCADSSLIPDDSCVPEVTSVSIRDVDAAEPSIVIGFKGPIEFTLLPTAVEVLRALEFTPPLIGLAHVTRIDDRSIELFASQDYVQILLKAHRNSEPIVIKPRLAAPRVFLDELSFRPVSGGTYEVFALNITSFKRVSNAIMISVDETKSSGTIELLPPLLSPSGVSAARALKDLPLPLHRMSGIVAISGEDGVIVPNSVAPVMSHGNWSVSMWIYLMQKPSSQYRALFYKGNSNSSNGRTPSAWFIPGSNLLTIRATSTVDENAGAVNLKEISTFQWKLLTFTFQNLTESKEVQQAQALRKASSKSGIRVSQTAEQEGGSATAGESVGRPMPETQSYVISLYQDSELDISMTFRDKVLGNTDPLHFFKDPSFGGHVGFVSDLVIWSDALLASDVSRLARRGPPVAARELHELVQSLHNSPHSAESGADAREVDSTVDVSSVLDKLLDPRQDRYRTGKETNPLKTATCQLNSDDSCRIGDVEAITVLESIKTTMENAQRLYPIPMRAFDLSDPIDESLFIAKHNEAQESFSACADVRTRIDRYEEASVVGGADARDYLVNWAALHLFGSEAADNRCGLSLIPFENTTASAVKQRHVSSIRALVRASAYGSYKAFLLLSSVILSGLSALETFVDLFIADSLHLCNNCVGGKGVLECPFEIVFACKLNSILAECNRSAHISKRSSVDSDIPISSVASAQCLHAGSKDGLLQLSIQLVHIAALGGSKVTADAYYSLGQRYANGIGVPKDVETGAYYTSVAASASSIAFHSLGGQPIVEADRINDATEKSVELGNMGDEDENIQLEMVRAAEGNVPSMITMGDINYFGARGVARDQSEALRYYEQAAAAHDPHGMCCAAAMHLKGEGLAQPNATRAIELYSEAANQGSVKALNGLGYIYFNGQGGVAKNMTKAFEYFLNATKSLNSDADAWFNTAYCMKKGLGVEKNESMAVTYYLEASRKFGHFGATFELGTMYLLGCGVDRSPTEALRYLSSVASMGPWVGWVRRGLDAYLEGQHALSAMCYLHAANIGDYEVAYSNAAYLIRRRLAEKPSFWASIYSASAKLVQSIQQYRESKDSRGLSTTVSNETAVHGESDSGDVFHASQLLRTLLNAARKGNVDAYSGVGDVFYKGSYVRFDGASDYSRALSWYEKAASRGVSVSHLNIAFMHQFGLGVPVNLIRAQQMYEKVIQKASSDASNELYSMPITIFSKAMLLWVKKSQKSPLTFAAINSIARKLVQSWHQHK